MSAFVSAVLCTVLLAACAGARVATPVPTTPGPATPTATPLPTVDPTDGPLPTPTSGSTYIPLPSGVPDPTPYHSPAATPSGPFSMDLYRRGAFVSEYEKYMCLPAAMQVMINIMKDGPVDTSFETQWRLYELARTFLIPPYVNGDTGAQPEGWSAALNAEGYGPYRMAIRPTMVDAIHLAAKQMRLTNKPVGLLVWRGAHSWSMSGFESDVDPAVSDDFTVTGIYVEDVWYPRISSIWGPSDPPDTLVEMTRLNIDYRHYRRPREVHPDKDGQWVLIVPILKGQEV
jgi:hypothetical protein